MKKQLPIILVYLSFEVVTLIFLIFLFIFRGEHQLKVRLPYVSITIGIIDAILIALIFVEEFFGLKCSVILWSGNLGIHFLLGCSLMRLWSFTVHSDRALRKEFRWTTSHIFLLKVAFCIFIYTICLTFLTSTFDQMYLKMARKEQCFFLLPIWDYAPTSIVYFIVRGILAAKVRRVEGRQKDKSGDYFGISGELKVGSIVFFCLFVAYFGYTFNFFRGWSKSEHTSAGFLAAWIPFSSVIFTVVLPVLKVFAARKNQQRNKTVKSKKNSRYANFLPVRAILADVQMTEKLRKHARRSLCGETVDFCVEVNAFKEKSEVFKFKEKQPFSDENKKVLHRLFLNILEEFVSDGSPSEVNISYEQKTRILQFKDFEEFCLLDTIEISSLFDEAQAEVEKLVQDNLMDSFSRISVLV